MARAVADPLTLEEKTRFLEEFCSRLMDNYRKVLESKVEVSQGDDRLFKAVFSITADEMVPETAFYTKAKKVLTE